MSDVPHDNEDLLALAKEISMKDFHQPFLHHCKYNSRLKSVGGRYLLTTHDIEINWHYAHKVGMNGLIDTIKHELCHYHLHLAGRGYRHRDQDFQQLLQKVNGLRYADREALPSRCYRYEYKCQSCGAKYLRKNRINLKKFVCGICHGSLSLVSELGPNHG